MFVKQCSIHGSRAKYIYGRKKQINYNLIPTSLFRGRPLINPLMYLLEVPTRSSIMVAYSSILDFRVEPGTSSYKEPKFIVFLPSGLVSSPYFVSNVKETNPMSQ